MLRTVWMYRLTILAALLVASSAGLKWGAP